MAIHDWSRVAAGIFHHFHNAWITHLSDLLNERVLPANYYAIAEQVASSGGPDVLTLKSSSHDNGEQLVSPSGGVATLSTASPQVTLIEDLAETAFLDNIAVRHVSDDRVVAMIEIVSPGNKSSQHPFERFLTKTAAWLSSGYHVLVIDLHPRTPRDPDGVHVALWAELGGNSQQASDSKPLTLASYRAGEPPQAFVEPIAVGDALTAMPIFLDGDSYVSAPLEESYQAAFKGTPKGGRGSWKSEHRF
jgi:hypothetical protein